MKSPIQSLEVAGEEKYGKLLAQAQAGDDEARDRLIQQFTPFILRVLARRTGKFHVVGDDDIVSIGMIAFNEAISSFDIQKGTAFLSFAEAVIHRRLIDYYRKEKHNSKVVPLSALESDGEEGNDVATVIIAKQAMSDYEVKSEADSRREEVLLYAKVLQEFDISFSELVNISPKHEDARVRAMQAARAVAFNQEMKNHLLKKKELPLKFLTNQVSVSRKTLERQRKYIIAVSIILIYEFTHLKEYVKGV